MHPLAIKYIVKLSFLTSCYAVSTQSSMDGERDQSHEQNAVLVLIRYVLATAWLPIEVFLEQKINGSNEEDIG